MACKVPLTNVKDVLLCFDKHLIGQIDNDHLAYGTICEDHRFQVVNVDFKLNLHLSITVNKISETVYQYTFRDITAIVKK